MLEIQKIKLEQALRVLNSLKDFVRYSVEWDGNTYGNAKLVPHKEPVVTKRRPLRYPYGTLAAYLSPYMDMLANEGVVEIPFGSFDAAALRSSVTATITNRFGKGRGSVVTNGKNKTIEAWLDLEMIPVGNVEDAQQIEMFDDGPTAAN